MTPAQIAFDAAPIGIVMTRNRVIKAANASFASMLGYSVPQLIGQSFRMFYSSDEEFHAIRDIGLPAMRASGKYTDERLVRHHDGHSIWCRFRANSLTPDDPLGQLVMSFAEISTTPQNVTLSSRERDVLGLMNQGLTSKQIAAHLGLSPRTIDDVRGRLIKRFGVKRAADLLGRMTKPDH